MILFLLAIEILIAFIVTLFIAISINHLTSENL